MKTAVVILFCAALFLMVTPGPVAVVALWIIGPVFGWLFFGWLLGEGTHLIGR